MKEVKVLIMPKKPEFSKEEEAIIARAVSGYKDQVRADFIATEIRNRILDEQRKKPGYRYY